MKRAGEIALLTAALLFSVGGVAYADGITVLMAATAFQLLIGNFFIGLIEGRILVWRYHVSSFRSLATMVVANYASAWGAVFLLWHIDPGLMKVLNKDEGPGLSLTFRPEMVLVGCAYVSTIMIEWPFCWWVLRGGDKKHKLVVESLKASALVNTLSYLVLVPLYFWARWLE